MFIKCLVGPFGSEANLIKLDFWRCLIMRKLSESVVIIHDKPVILTVSLKPHYCGVDDFVITLKLDEQHRAAIVSERTILRRGSYRDYCNIKKAIKIATYFITPKLKPTKWSY